MAVRALKRFAGIRQMILISLFLGLLSAPAAALTLAKGVVLVAREGTVDPRFQKSVVLILQHGSTGTVGLIVNKVMPINLDHLPDLLPESVFGDQPLHYGGPVNPSTIWLLFSSRQKPAGSIEILPGLYVDNADRFSRESGRKLDASKKRLLSGYAGWAPGQLLREVERGGWSLRPGRIADVFDDDPESLWEYLRGKASGLVI